MFILNSTDEGTLMFAKGQKVVLDFDLWHKRIGHVNYQRLQDLQSKQVVFGLPKFSAGRHKFVKPGSLGSNTDFLSPMSETGAGISST